MDVVVLLVGLFYVLISIFGIQVRKGTPCEKKRRKRGVFLDGMEGAIPGCFYLLSRFSRGIVEAREAALLLLRSETAVGLFPDDRRIFFSASPRLLLRRARRFARQDEPIDHAYHLEFFGEGAGCLRTTRRGESVMRGERE